MINVSNEFKKKMNERTDFKQYAVMTLSNGTVITLSKEDFSIENNSLVDSADTSGIPLGVAICRNVQIEIDNRDERYSDIDFFGAKIRLYLTFELSETEEKIEYGTFTVLEPETYGDTVIITALDDMYRANREYSTNLQFPATIKSILIDACSTIDIPLGSTSFLNDNFVVSQKPTDITFRQLFGYIAMIAGGNARIDRTGRLRIITYDFSVIEDIQSRIDGGSYTNWTNPIFLDGGNFTDYSSGDIADGGTFELASNYHILSNWKDTLVVDTDDVVITGISTTKEEENGEKELIYGIEGYVLKIENPLIVGQEQLALELIGSVMVGGTMRRFNGDLVANPTCEFMDTAAVTDRKGNVYATILTDVNFNFFGFTVLSNSAAPAMRNSSQAYSAATETFVSAKKLVEREKTEREKAVEQLAKDLKNSSGLFMTEEKQADGSIIYYMHDKPTLAESMIVWKLTALAFGISTDGGKTYPYGFTVDGEVITRLLYAEGIDADYITSGAITVKDSSGNISFSVDVDTKTFQWNSQYSSMTTDGKITATGGKIGGFTIGPNSISSGKANITDGSNGIYIGTDGISIGFTGNGYGGIQILSSGAVNIYGASMSNLSVSDSAYIGGVQIGGNSVTLGYMGVLTCATISGCESIGGPGGGISLGLGGVSITGGSIGFFGASSYQQSVSQMPTYGSVTAEDVANKVNELIGALSSYGLV